MLGFVTLKCKGDPSMILSQLGIFTFRFLGNLTLRVTANIQTQHGDAIKIGLP
jgi:hypothetical protein